jgi:hypothetical protein
MPADPSMPSCPGRCPTLPTRRDLLRTGANGFGWLALSALMADRSFAGTSAATAGVTLPHFKPRAKNVIFCFMDGGVSHVDSFDPKPKLAELDGKDAGKIDNPTSIGSRRWLRSPWKFQRYGRSGLEVSELFPHIGACADELAVIRSMKVEQPLHPNGVLFLHTGHTVAGRPSLGAWLNYGLGSVNQNLPGFVVLNFGNIPMGGMENFSNGFLPASFQGTIFRADGTPIDNVIPADKDQRVQRAKLDLLRQQDLGFSRRLGVNDAIESAVQNYETAYRMQAAVPDVLDLGKESRATQKLYGIDSPIESKRQYGTQCLRARRLVEAGVRFVEVNCPAGGPPNGAWDQHGALKKTHEKNAMDTDQPIAGLIKDLRSRGLLEETLILWAGEFGRSPHAAGRDGRDHHHEGFTVWLAGGGVKGGTIYGATDEMGMRAVENVVTMHDLHATILYALGIDHERLTYRSGGRDFRLTDVSGRPVKEIFG